MAHLPAPALATHGALSRVTPRDLLDDWLDGLKDTTRRAYQGDLRRFAAWLDVDSIDQAAAHLFGLHPGDANALALRWRNALQAENKAPNTINRYLSSLRSLVDLAQTLGLVVWNLKIRGLKATPYRDTRGPGRKGYLEMLQGCGDPSAEGRGGRLARRNRAILRLLYDLALRRSEVASLRLEDLDLARSAVRVLGKGKHERELLNLPGPTQDALEVWLEDRGEEPGPLFVRLDNAASLTSRGSGLHRRPALTGEAIYGFVRRLGTHPHGLRHSAITDALDLTGGDVRQVRHFSRHASVRTLQFYDDAREDFGGKIARQVAGAATE